ncbi:flagellar protein FlaG [Bacillus alkalisoli]|uniref:flagellar protein FlaG n=1 Tax=Bacillus alkalisoli TaxID=2011008 RepID=UPI000C245447|nr:flagellar protein FlaG [Bacillus alkalisoli]
MMMEISSSTLTSFLSSNISTTSINSTSTIEKQPVTQEEQSKVEHVVKSMNQFLQPLNTNVQFSFHEELNEYYVAIIDQETKEVVKEIPPKKLLDMYAEMAKFMGLFVDQKI